MLREAPNLHCVSCSEATLLGTPTGGEEGVSRSISAEVSMLERMGERLSERLGTFSSYAELLLHRSSFVIPKVLYISHTTPCFLSPELAGFDALLCRLLCTILNVSMEDESMWLQATLPVSCGGTGIRGSVQLVPSAYLASAAGYSELIPQILPSHLKSSSDIYTCGMCTQYLAVHSQSSSPFPSFHSPSACVGFCGR